MTASIAGQKQRIAWACRLTDILFPRHVLVEMSFQRLTKSHQPSFATLAVSDQERRNCISDKEVATIQLRNFHNSKIGPDYMLPGQQKKVLTPGKNVKHYVAGAMDVRTGRVIWVDSNRKRSALFIELLKKLDRLYVDKKVIHIILDNYIIHSSKITQKAVMKFKGRIVLHFLPPYCPDDNKIERCVWRDLHANVTRNHTCRDMDELMREVRRYLAKMNRSTAAKRRREAA
jgi:transposase